MKTCLITGATSGIGRAAAGDLGRRGWRLLLSGRNESAGRRLLAEMRRAFPGAPADFFPADLSELEAVRALAAWVSNRTDRLDGLINNAGARFDHYGQTTAGVERTFATNHLGHFLLTSLLADLVTAGGGRIIMLGSVAHQWARPTLGWNLGAAHYDGKVAYANAKLACILFARELARRMANTNVIACAVDPGIVATAFARNNGWLAWCKHRLYHRFKGNLISAAAGAAGVVHVATVEAVRLKRGGYYRGEQLEEGASSATEDAVLARELWEASERLSGIHGIGGEVEQAGAARPQCPARV